MSYRYIRPQYPYMEHATLNTCPVRKSYRYILDHNTHVYMKHTTLTTCPVRTVQSLYYISPSTYGTHITAQFVQSIQ